MRRPWWKVYSGRNIQKFVSRIKRKNKIERDHCDFKGIVSEEREREIKSKYLYLMMPKNSMSLRFRDKTLMRLVGFYLDETPFKTAAEAIGVSSRTAESLYLKLARMSSEYNEFVAREKDGLTKVASVLRSNYNRFTLDSVK